MGNLLQGLGQAKPVSEFINAAQTYQANDQQGRIRQLQLDELQKQQEHLDQTVDFRLTPFYLSLPESARPQADQMFKNLGAFDENYRGTRRSMYQAVGEIEKNKDALKSLMQPVIDAKAQGVAKAFEAFRKNPEDPRLKAAYETAQMEHAASSGKILDHIKALEAQDAATFHNIPEGGTGVLINKRGEQVGTPILGNPKRVDRWSDPYDENIDGKTVRVQRNETTGQIRTVAQGSTTNVNVGVNTGLEKGARAKAQEEVQEGTDLYTGLQRVLEISRPEYFTYAGQIQARAEKVGEKAGMVKDPALLRGYSAWKVGVEQEFNKYRKWVTGVAAGPVELELIRQTFPNKDMSETEFQAAARQTAVTTWKLVERRRRALAAGIMDEKKQKDFYSLLPLDAMPNPPAEFLDRFAGGGSTEAARTAEEYLRKRGIR